MAAPDAKACRCRPHLRPSLRIERKQAQRANLNANTVTAAFCVINSYQVHQQIPNQEGTACLLRSGWMFLSRPLSPYWIED
jgi:hypothetical protein